VKATCLTALEEVGRSFKLRHTDLDDSNLPEIIRNVQSIFHGFFTEKFKKTEVSMEPETLLFYVGNCLFSKCVWIPVDTLKIRGLQMLVSPGIKNRSVMTSSVKNFPRKTSILSLSRSKYFPSCQQGSNLLNINIKQHEKVGLSKYDIYNY